MCTHSRVKLKESGGSVVTLRPDETDIQYRSQIGPYPPPTLRPWRFLVTTFVWTHTHKLRLDTPVETALKVFLGAKADVSLSVCFWGVCCCSSRLHSFWSDLKEFLQFSALFRPPGKPLLAFLGVFLWNKASPRSILYHLAQFHIFPLT